MTELTATQHSIKLFPDADESSTVIVDETHGESYIRNKLTTFFRNKHGKRETYTFYRGFIIVRNTVNFSNGPQRRTTVYLFAEEGWSEGTRADVFCCGSDFSGVPQAKRYIDRTLKDGIRER